MRSLLKNNFATALWKNKNLLWQFLQREALGRYRGSLLGWGWSLLQPLAMLTVYTFVFSQVFRSRWGTGEEGGSLYFAINLFAGLIVYNLFSECVSKAPTLITVNPNYVKKVVFPLEILAAASVGSALFHALTSLLILMIFEMIAFHRLPFTYLSLPLTWLPLVLGSLGSTLLLSAAGVFLRDINQIVNVLLNMLMFVSPIFFPLSALPPRWLPVLQINPIAHVIESTRLITVAGKWASWQYLIFGNLIAIVFCEISFRIFRSAKKAFGDVM